MFSWFGNKIQKFKSLYDAAERRTYEIMDSGQRQYPSWIMDPTWKNTLTKSTFDEVRKSGLTEEQTKRFFLEQRNVDAILTLVAQLEIAKFNKLDQISGAMEFAVKLAKDQR